MRSFAAALRRPKIMPANTAAETINATRRGRVQSDGKASVNTFLTKNCISSSLCAEVYTKARTFQQAARMKANGLCGRCGTVRAPLHTSAIRAEA